MFLYAVALASVGSLAAPLSWLEFSGLPHFLEFNQSAPSFASRAPNLCLLSLTLWVNNEYFIMSVRWYVSGIGPEFVVKFNREIELVRISDVKLLGQTH